MPTRETLDTLKALAIKVAHLKIEPSTIRDNANLFDDCGLDSTSVVALVWEVEDAFGIQISEEEIEPKLLEDMTKLAEFVELKRTASHGNGAS
jgi:acyl carrier protein